MGPGAGPRSSNGPTRTVQAYVKTWKGARATSRNRHARSCGCVPSIPFRIGLALICCLSRRMGDDQPDGPEARGGYVWASKDEVDSLRIQRQSWAESQIKNETLVISLMQEVHRLRDEMKCVSIPCVFAPCSAHAPASSGQDAALLRVTRMNQMQAFAARRGCEKHQDPAGGCLSTYVELSCVPV
jgi:hypothetical protein